MKEIKLENDKDLTTWAVESALMHQSMTNKRFFIIIVILIVALIGTNAGWILYETSFEDITITQENEDGYNNYIGNDGDIHNHE